MRTVSVTVMGSQPSWSPDTAIVGGLQEPTSDRNLPPGGSLVFTALTASDTDRRSSPQGTTYPADTVTRSWSCSGGSFSGDLQSGTVTWNAPSSPGDYTVTLMVDGQGAVPAGEIGSRDDPERTFTVMVRVRHVHNWASTHDISPATFSVDQQYPAHGERVQLTASGAGSDTDQCLAANCPFPGGAAPNVTRKHRWTAPAGRFVYQSNGNWITSTDPAQVTHWEAPGNSGPVTLTLETEDTPQATDPEIGTTIATFNDQPGLHAVQVRVVTHRHTWEAVDNVPAEVTVDNENPMAGDLVRVGGGYMGSGGMDMDHCTGSGCSFSGGWIYNNTYVTAWVATAAGQSVGTFGRLDGMGQFVAWQQGEAASTITHWKAPAAIPAAGPAVVLKVQMDDGPPVPPTV